ncbi:MAG: hypothetical protein M3O41_14010 [Pseudomonadota bacterium]|nr:hypothetical protein [Pseudomonadota bacterium]
MFPTLSANLLLAIIATGATGLPNTAAPPLTDFDTVQWSLDRLGSKQTILKVPSAYGTGSPIARKFSAAVETKHRKFSDQAFQILLIHAMWPDLAPMSPDWHEFNEHQDPNAMAATITSGAVEGEGSPRSDALQEWFHQVSYTAGINLCFGNDQPKTCYFRNAPDVKSPKYGLERIGVDFSKYPAFPEVDRSEFETRDVYFLREPTGVVSTLIHCTAEESKTAADGPAYKGVAQCDQKFISKKLNALVSITYPRPLLKNWSEIQARWLSLLDSIAPGETGRHQSTNR